ncbi:hypothetical protein HPB50_027454 [Hyalomma asiaticum]|uniref:Uncharacterized protein n=1 Tax=Hyalomma asiaticum TaxID=266040 RepID=A0ACB7S0F2_HYAAI|nr:hypothetical protein HPB50_027454 [Hyalomma asiaticum]
MSGTPLYLLTPGGLLKMVEISFAVPSLVLLSSLSFNDMSGQFEMQHGDLSLTMTIFAFATSSAILLMTIVNGSDDLPQMQLYRINYAVGTLLLSLNTFMFYVRYTTAASVSNSLVSADGCITPAAITGKELRNPSYAFYLCVGNTMAYALNLLYALRAQKTVAESPST